MKKILRRIVLLVLGIVLCYQHFCYADVAVNRFVFEVKMSVSVACILFVLIISYLSLKFITQKEQKIDKTSIMKKVNYICLAIFVIASFSAMFSTEFYYDIYDLDLYDYPIICLIAVIILMLVFIIAKIRNKNKVANITIFMAIIITVIADVYTLMAIEAIMFIILSCLIAWIILLTYYLKSKKKEENIDEKTAMKMKKIKKTIIIIPIIIIIMLIILGYGFVQESIEKEEEEKYRQEKSEANGGLVLSTSLKQFNNQFTQYEGPNEKGSSVKSLYQAVLLNNVRQDSEKRQVSISGVVTLNKEDTKLPEQFYSIPIQATYSVKMIYNKYGKIESIHIEENQ